jgi:kumamolisin
MAFARAHDLAVMEVSAARHDVVLEGDVAALNRAFGVELGRYRHLGHAYHGHEDDVGLPAALAGAVVGVLGLDGVPLRRLLGAASGFPGAISPLTLTEHYCFPAALRGAGQRIAIVALGGGYHSDDVQGYFRDVLGIEAPVVRPVFVNGGKNDPLPIDKLKPMVEAYNDPAQGMAELSKRFGDAFEGLVSTAETTMDVEIAGACAPEAAIDVLFAPNDGSGLYHAVYAAVGLGSDAVNEDGTPYREEPATVISVSWGSVEAATSGYAATALERALQQAVAVGTLVCCSSGDLGSVGESGAKQASVLYPASSASVLSCGGTTFSGGKRSGLGEEVAWNSPNRGITQATGGGVSGIVSVPAWQARVGVPARAALNGAAWVDESIPVPQQAAFVGRGVPDVAAFADPIPGYLLLLGGVRTSAGGTSAATPLWAALVARLAQGLGRRLPWLSEVLYRPAVAATFRPITKGDDALGVKGVATFEAGPEWNACCGLGVPDGEALLGALRSALGPPSP